MNLGYKELRECKDCGKKFIVTHQLQRYCKSCRDKKNRNKRKPK